MSWVHYVLPLILFRHNNKGRKKTSHWQKDNNCSESCPQCYNLLWRGSLTRVQRQQRYYALPFVSFILTLSTWELPADFSLCLATFPFDFHHQNLMGTWREYFHDKTISMGFFETQKYAFKSNCRHCFKTIRIWDDTYKFKSKLTLSSSGLIHFHPTSLSWGKYYLRRLIDVLGSKFSRKHQFKIITGSKGWQWNSLVSPPPRSPQKITRVNNDQIGVW